MKEEKDLSVQVTNITSAGADGFNVDIQAVASQQISISQVAVELTAEQKLVALKRMQLGEVVSFDDLPLSATFMLEKIGSLALPDAMEALKETVIAHKDDPNFSVDAYNFIEKLIDMYDSNDSVVSTKSKLEANFDSTDVKEVPLEMAKEESDDSYYFNNIFDFELQARIEASLILYWSPYPEVRAISDPFDDPTILCETWRAYVCGTIWVGISSFINQYFAQRYPAITLPATATQLLIYPCGMVLSFLPNWKFTVYKGYQFQLNPGAWTHKEQMLSTMMVSITTTPYIEGPIYALKSDQFYNFKWASWGFQILLGIGTQFLGFGFAGIIRKFCIYPTKSIWPTVMPNVAINRALLLKSKKENINGWTISKYKFFFFVFMGSFIYYWLPGYLFTALSTFSWIAWISPNNFKLAAVTGTYSGLGLNPISSFDWNVINIWAFPLQLPAFNAANSVIGSLISVLAVIGVYFSNKYWTAYLPINSSGTYTNKGESYAVTEVLNSKNELDLEKYKAYGPPFYTAGNLVLYGAFFASYPFTILYVSATNWRDIAYSFKSFYHSVRYFKNTGLEAFHDPHSKMMRSYKEVPDWVFFVILIVSIVLGIICVEVYPTDTPVWGIFFVVALNFVFLIPFTVLYSITGFQMTMNVLVELIVGYALPGKPVAHLILKSFGTQTDIQAQDYVSNQKIGHYTKIPPWSAFRVQMLATFVNLFVSLAVINWQLTSIEGFCTPTQKQHFTCSADAQIYYTASVFWGLIGPKRVFDHLYPMLKYCFLIGFLLTFPCYLIHRVLPRRLKKWWQPTIIIGAFLNYLAPYNFSYIINSFYLSMIFMVFIKKRYLAWWEKYNYILAGGLSSGLGLCSIILFFAVQYHPKDISWWGNDVNNRGIDGGMGQQSYYDVADAPHGYFGPRKGNFL